MTALPVTLVRLTCDTCGAARDELTIGSTKARIDAAQEGWTYIQYDIKGKGFIKRVPNRQNGRLDNENWSTELVPRQWDCCPDCTLPPGPLEAKAVAEARAK